MYFMSKKAFKSESKKLLDMMIHSIYTNSDIFLRELISNASDALDKRYYESLKNNNAINKDELSIHLTIDPSNRMFTIADNGIGMDKEELEKNLGTIARSGSSDFKQSLDQSSNDIDIIGQFGVGFYSAFMVADSITVESKKEGCPANLWISSGADGYEIKDSNRDNVGTTITLHIKDDNDQANYSKYLEEYEIKNLVTKYSDYIRYPITMDCKVSKQVGEAKDGEEPKYEEVIERQTLNSMIPLWKKDKSSITEEQYNDFYKSKFMDWQDPAKTFHFNVEGNVSYTALLYIPSNVPYNFYSSDYQGGLQLYCKGVFIMDCAKDLLPEHFRFVKGLVDSDDLNLNISRELLQQDYQVKQLKTSLEKKIKRYLLDMLNNEREAYEKFYDNFGLTLKYGIYADYGQHKDLLQDLILFKSSKENKYVTLKEYVANMKEDQKEIYYACGATNAAINALPQMEKVLDKGYEVLYFTQDVDEFATMMMHDYDGKTFKSVNQGNLDLDTEEEKQARETLANDNKDLLTRMKDALKDKVNDVRISDRLKSHPVCLVSEQGMSLEMEKVLNAGPNNPNVKAQTALELNSDHPLFKTLQSLMDKDPALVDTYASLLYDQARLIDGLSIEDPVAYTNAITELMINSNK